MVLFIFNTLYFLTSHLYYIELYEFHSPKPTRDEHFSSYLVPLSYRLRQLNYESKLNPKLHGHIDVRFLLYRTVEELHDGNSLFVPQNPRCALSLVSPLE